MPTRAYTKRVNPEQSNPDGLVPPQTYGVPRYSSESRATWSPIVTTPGAARSTRTPAGAAFAVPADTTTIASAVSKARMDGRGYSHWQRIANPEYQVDGLQFH